LFVRKIIYVRKKVISFEGKNVKTFESAHFQAIQNTEEKISKK